DIVYFKIGRTNGLTRRISQWWHTCRSAHYTLVRYWPCDSEAEITNAHPQVERPSPHVSMLERLVHYELTDRAVNTPYLYH
ncbi:hypothetical protein C8Q80DRAFT_1107632, partial [Daedaleopsis nitida]